MSERTNQCIALYYTPNAGNNNEGAAEIPGRDGIRGCVWGRFIYFITFYQRNPHERIFSWAFWAAISPVTFIGLVTRRRHPLAPPAIFALLADVL